MIRITSALFVLLVCICRDEFSWAADQHRYGRCQKPHHFDTHPVLCQMLDKLHEDPQAMANSIHQHALKHKLLVGHDFEWEADANMDKQDDEIGSQQERHLNLRTSTHPKKSKGNLPVVFAHGMGDSCFNSGMQHITKHTGDMLGVYAVCIPTGANQAQDTHNGYFLNMDANVDIFAQAVANNTELKDGFHAIGFSQGNNVIRGYLAKHNQPAVHSFLSVNGVNAGEGALPHCSPTLEEEKQEEEGVGAMNMCELLMEQASKAAYTEFAQEHNFQANYWRDPRPVAFPRYQEYAQLAKWNNEAGFINETLRENWKKTQVFVWVLATEDGMVFPREGEHWMAPDPNDPFERVLPMKETEWYKQDLFGLRTADEAGKNFFECFVGDHLQFTMEDFDRWVRTYLTVKDDADSLLIF